MTPSTATVLMKDDGTGAISMNMNVAAFHEKALELGWSCSPKTGTDKYGTITVGLNQFNFLGDGLYRVDIGDPAFSTEKGLRVGDNIETMMRLYGAPDSQDVLPDNGGVAYSYALSATFGMSVTVKAGKVHDLLFG